MTTLYIDLDDNDNLFFRIIRIDSTSNWGTCIANILQCSNGRLAIGVPNFVSVPLKLIPESLYKADKSQIMTYLQTYYPEYLL